MKHPGHTYGGFVPSISERGMTTAGGNSKVEYTYGWYSASAGNKLYAKDNNKVKCIKVVSRITPTLDS
jgi:hypothetical protein